MKTKIMFKHSILFLLQSLALTLFSQDSTSKIVFSYTGSDQMWTVPAGITEITVKAWGAGGAGGNYVFNDIGGGGVFVSGRLHVKPGEQLTIIVGGGGQPGAGPGAYGGGGAKDFGPGGRGGGRSAIVNSSGKELITAGAGGGGGGVAQSWQTGGHGGGGLFGQQSNWPPYDGLPGTLTKGGKGGHNSFYGGDGEDGSLHQGGKAGYADNGYTGSGGGGFYGGGGGSDVGDGAGGGGSSFVPRFGSTYAAQDNIPGNTSDPDYGNNAGRGGQKGKPGNPGRIVIIPERVFHGKNEIIDDSGIFADSINDFTEHTYNQVCQGLYTYADCNITRIFSAPVKKITLTIVSGTVDDVGYIGSKLVSDIGSCTVLGTVVKPVNVTDQIQIDGNKVHLLLRAQDNCCIYTGWGEDNEAGRLNARLHWQVEFEGCTKPEAVITPLTSLDLCQTSSVILSANKGTGLTYQWRKDSSKIPGATARTYSVQLPGVYTVVVTDSTGCRKTSKGVTVINSCSLVASNNEMSKSTLSDNKLSLYPSPSSGKITVEYNSNLSGSIPLIVYNVTGKKVYSATESAIKGFNVFHLNLSNFSPGVYYLELTSDVTQKRVKFIIER